MAVFTFMDPTAPDPLAALPTCICTLTVGFLLTAIMAYSAHPQISPSIARPSFLSFLTGKWVWRHIRYSGDQPPSAADFPVSPGTESFNAEMHVNNFSRTWKDGVPTGLLAHNILWFMGPCICKSALVKFYDVALMQVVDAFVLRCIIQFIRDERQSSAIGWWIFALVITKKMFQPPCYCYSHFVMGFDPRGCLQGAMVALRVLVTRKLRRIGPEALAQTSQADFQQVMNDIQTAMFDGTLAMRHLPAAVGLAMWSLMNLSKLFNIMSVTTGIITGVAAFQLQMACHAEKVHCNNGARKLNKERIEIVVEVAKCLLPLKLYSWASEYIVPLNQVTQKASQLAKKAATWSALDSFLGSAVVDIGILVTMGVSAFVSNEELVFDEFVVARVYVAALKGSILDIQAFFKCYATLKNSTARIEAFLRLPDHADKPAHGPLAIASGEFAVGVMENGSVGWKTVLTSVDFQAKQGELILVSGPVGSGKSSLLLALAGELHRTAGQASRPVGKMAFQPQMPYLLDDTIRANVIFGSIITDEADLQTAFIASQLAVDLDDEESTLHVQREDTSVGLRGGSLSGGQRARTALARAVYAVLSGATVALLDDPFSAIDGEMVASAWEKAVKISMANTTRIVVVNSQLLQRLGPDADRIVWLEGGKIVYNGAPAEIMADTALLARLGSAYQIQPLMDKTPTRDKPLRLKAVAKAIMSLMPTGRDGNSPEAAKHTYYEEPVEATVNVTEADVMSLCKIEDHQQAIADLVKFYDTSHGMRKFLESASSCTIPPRVTSGLDSSLEQGPLPLQLERAASAPAGYAPPLPAPLQLTRSEWEQFRKLLLRVEQTRLSLQQQPPVQGPAPAKAKSELEILISFFCLNAFWTISSSAATLFSEACGPALMGLWSDRASQQGELADGTNGRVLFFSTFAFFVVGQCMFAALSEWLQARGLDQLSCVLNSDIDKTLVSLAQPYFWYGHKLGELLNVVQTQASTFTSLCCMPQIMGQTMFSLLAIVWKMPGLLPLLLFAAWALKKCSFAKTWAIGQLAPYKQKVLSNILQRASDEFDSLYTIRAMGVEEHFDVVMQCAATAKCYVIQQLLGGVFINGIMQMLSEAVFFGGGVLFVMRAKDSGGDAASAIVVFQLIVSLNSKLGRLQGQRDKADACIGQYRLVEDFLRTPHKEFADFGELPPKSWPSSGALEFQQVCFRYVTKAPLALQNVSISIGAGEKIGVVGPTGAGKSTLLNLLFRLGPLKGVDGPGGASGGRILLDSVDIATVKLGALRAALGVVPQEPTMFEGSLKHNLGDKITEHDALAALKACGLEDLATKEQLNKNLADLAEFSVGEKQLLAAARALTHKPRIMVLDEATSALDMESAERLLQVIAKQCANVTVLSIAHRLRFVAKCDRVLVLKRGGTVEAFDRPGALMQTPDCYFAVQMRYEEAAEQLGT